MKQLRKIPFTTDRGDMVNGNSSSPIPRIQLVLPAVFGRHTYEAIVLGHKLFSTSDAASARSNGTVAHRRHELTDAVPNDADTPAKSEPVAYKSRLLS